MRTSLFGWYLGLEPDSDDENEECDAIVAGRFKEESESRPTLKRGSPSVALSPRRSALPSSSSSAPRLEEPVSDKEEPSDMDDEDDDVDSSMLGSTNC